MTNIMKIIAGGTEGGLEYISLPAPPHFDISKIFDCGQCFRFEPFDSRTYEGVAYGRYLRIRQDDGILTLFGTNEREFDELWCRFLSLDEDYSKINESILSEMQDEKTIKSAIECGDGIRILRQEKWETLCSFIISQNNNIPRIKKIISALCESLGDEISVGDRTFYAFPSPERIVNAGIDFLLSLKTGFRAKYILDAATKFPSLPLDDMETMDFSQADELLRTISGVGPKVSSCVLLFSFSQVNAFPVDVWIKRVLEKYYSSGISPLNIKNYGGIAQQYLFYYERYGFSK